MQYCWYGGLSQQARRGFDRFYLSKAQTSATKVARVDLDKGAIHQGAPFLSNVWGTLVLFCVYNAYNLEL